MILSLSFSAMIITQQAGIFLGLMEDLWYYYRYWPGGYLGYGSERAHDR